MIDKALRRLHPTAEFQVSYGDDMTTHKIEWFSTDIKQPNSDELNLEISKIIREDALANIQTKRAVEYPPITDYIDGVVKGDQEQIQAYIDACLAVKAKYPKPE
jgi:hypothetical protein